MARDGYRCFCARSYRATEVGNTKRIHERFCGFTERGKRSRNANGGRNIEQRGVTNLVVLRDGKTRMVSAYDLIIERFIYLIPDCKPKEIMGMLEWMQRLSVFDNMRAKVTNPSVNSFDAEHQQWLDRKKMRRIALAPFPKACRPAARQAALAPPGALAGGRWDCR